MIEMMHIPVISTAHVTAEVASVLDKGPIGDAWAPTFIHTYGYGWIVWVQQDECVKDIPQCLMDVFTWAKAQGYEWVRFDCDAETCDDLPTYEW